MHCRKDGWGSFIQNELGRSKGKFGEAKSYEKQNVIDKVSYSEKRGKTEINYCYKAIATWFANNLFYKVKCERK